MSLSDVTHAVVAVLTADLNSEEGNKVKRALIAVLWRFGILFFVCMSLDLLRPVGVSGFARAADVERKVQVMTDAIADLSKSAKAQALSQLSAAIVDARTKKCRASKQETKDIYSELIKADQAQYYAIAGQYYAVPSCEDL